MVAIASSSHVASASEAARSRSRSASPASQGPSEDESGERGDEARGASGTASRAGAGVGRGRVARRLAGLAALRWTAEQEAVLGRAERLRLSGRSAVASREVAMGCPLPPRLRLADHAMCVRLDLRRWYEAMMGEPWDGREHSLIRARERAGELRRRPTAARDACAHGCLRMCHLMAEPLEDQRAAGDALADFAASTGWPGRVDVGRLEWDLEDGLACAFCDALLLPSEAVYDVNGAASRGGVPRGAHCCKSG